MPQTITGNRDGLDLTQPDSWTQAEEQAFTDYYQAIKEGTMAGHDLWIELRPDVLKRYRHYVFVMDGQEGKQFPKIGPLMFLHHYAIVGFNDGIHYQMVNVRNKGGADKDAIVSTLAVAFLQSGPLGTAAVAAAAGDYLRGFQPPSVPTGWPEGWTIDPGYFSSGLDFSDAELSSNEYDLLCQWYERVLGSVPAHVNLLWKHRPTVLKAYRHRFEFAVKNGLPSQMVPLMLLLHDIIRARPASIRQSALMAKNLGVAKSFAMDAVCRGGLYGGTAAFDLVDEVAGDVFETWD